MRRFASKTRRQSRASERRAKQTRWPTSTAVSPVSRAIFLFCSTAALLNSLLLDDAAQRERIALLERQLAEAVARAKRESERAARLDAAASEVAAAAGASLDAKQRALERLQREYRAFKRASGAAGAGEPAADVLESLASAGAASDALRRLRDETARVVQIGCVSVAHFVRLLRMVSTILDFSTHARAHAAVAALLLCTTHSYTCSSTELDCKTATNDCNFRRTSVSKQSARCFVSRPIKHFSSAAIFSLSLSRVFCALLRAGCHLATNC